MCLSTKHKNKHNVAKAILFVIVLLGGVGAFIAYFAQGNNAAPLNPKGVIAAQQSHLMFMSASIVMAVAVPTVLLLYFFAWKYRESNNKATYHSEAHHGKLFVVSIWLIPTIAMLVLAIILVPVTRKLDPKKSVVTDRAPITIQVVALRWKWLFLYPEQQIASVNTLTIPKDQPVVFELTADDAPMSSFWIPNLAGQLYAMTGHVNRLNILATQNGDYPGSSAEINGKGFAGMRFITHVTSDQDYKTWLNQVKGSSGGLDMAAYNHLLQPTEDQPAATYSGYADDLYNKVIMKYMGSHAGHDMSSMSHEGQQ